MKKNFIVWLVISVTVMWLLPWVAFTIAKGDAKMVVFVILFYIVNPIYSVLIGVFSGRNDDLCRMPFISAGLFLTGTWILFRFGEWLLMLQYALLYLILGIIIMFISKY